MTQYSIELKTRKYVKRFGFLLFTTKYKKQILDKGLDASKKVVHKADKFIRNKIVDAVTTSSDDNIEKQEPVKEIIIPPEKKRGNINKTEKRIIKMEHYKISKLLNDSSILKFVTNKWIEVNDLSSGQYSASKNIRF